MRVRKAFFIVALISLLAAVPGTAREPYDDVSDGCCWDCAHYIYVSPSGESQERWDCLGFDCRSGYRDCWEYATNSRTCILMWSCRFF